VDDGKLASMLGNALGTGTGLAVTLLILWRVLSRMAERWIAALDRIADRVDAHTKVDVEHHQQVKESVVRVEAKVDAAMAWQARDHDREREHTPPDAIPVRHSPPSERRRFRTVPNRKPED
jgi:hypothetical protein